MPGPWARTLCALLVALACIGSTGCAGSDARRGSTETSAAATWAGQAEPAPATGSSGSSIAVTLDERGLATMTRIVRAAGLERRLSGVGPFTLVAPDERAFDTLPANELSRLCGERDRAEAFVLDHLLAGRVPLEALSDGLLTLTIYTPEGLEEAGHRLTWSVRDGAVEVDGARVTAAVEAANGIIYVVDRPLPPAPDVWTRPARASPGERVTVICRWVDSDGTPVAGARCMFGWHFGGWMPHDETVTDARGVARCTRIVPAEPGTRRVLVTVTARGPRPTRTVVAAFAVR